MHIDVNLKNGMVHTVPISSVFLRRNIKTDECHVAIVYGNNAYSVMSGDITRAEYDRLRPLIDIVKGKVKPAPEKSTEYNPHFIDPVLEVARKKLWRVGWNDLPIRERYRKSLKTIAFCPADVLGMDEDDLIKHPGVGKVCVRELRKVLEKQYGIKGVLLSNKLKGVFK